MTPSPLEPDQQTARWDDHVSVYEEVFEPFSLQFANVAIERLGVMSGARVLDVGAGSGGAALALFRRGCLVTAIDGAAGMVARTSERAAAEGAVIETRVMDGQALAFENARFDAAISVFGVSLFPDAVRGLAEMRRVVKPGGRVAVVTWTDPQAYELAVALRAAMEAVQPMGPPGGLPAQLRFRDRDDCLALFRAAGFETADIETHGATLHAPSVRWLSERISFAPGMAHLLSRAGNNRARMLAKFVADEIVRQGEGTVRFRGRAFVAIGNVT